MGGEVGGVTMNIYGGGGWKFGGTKGIVPIVGFIWNRGGGPTKNVWRGGGPNGTPGVGTP